MIPPPHTTPPTSGPIVAVRWRDVHVLAVGGPGLHCLWDLAHEVDVQQPVLQARTLDLHMVGELEATFEVPRGDALVEHIPRASPDLKIKNSDKISCEYQLRERSVNKYLRWHDQITRSRGPKRNVTLSATRLSLDSSSLIDTSSLKDHLYVPQPTPKPTRWQPKGSSIFERTGWAR